MPVAGGASGLAREAGARKNASRHREASSVFLAVSLVTNLGPLRVTETFRSLTHIGSANMYAIIADSGKQFKVEEGLQLEIDLRDAKEGDSITFDRVLALSSEAGFKLGQPLVAGATVTAKVLGMVKGEKLVVQKFRRRKNSRRRTGHRQKYTKVVIEKING